MSNAIMPIGVTAVMLQELDFTEQLELCRELGVTHYCFRPRYIPDDCRDKPYSSHGNHKFDLTPERLLSEGGELRAKLEAYGMTAFGSVPYAMIEHSDEQLALHFDGAAAAGAGRVRVQPYGYPAGPFNYEELLERTVARYREVIAIAQARHIKIVIETHARSLAASPGLALAICKHFDPSEIGVIFDLPNYASEGNLQPNLAVAVIRDYIDHCHIGGTRRTTGEYDVYGFRQARSQMCPMDESDLNIPEWLVALHQADVHVPLLIEDYTASLTGRHRLTHCAEATKRALTAIHDTNDANG